MRVFVTGATGFIGQAIVHELGSAGHTVLGLARNDAAADALTRAGIEVHRGELSDTASLAAAARVCDGVIHTAFIHDFSAFQASVETDRLAVAALAEALNASGKPLVITSGTALLGHGRDGTATEHDAAISGAPRSASEEIVLAAAGRGVRSSVVRLAPSVHDAGDYGFVPRLIDIARRTGFAAYIGDGENRWPAVHRLDAARLYRLAVEKAPAGSRLHGTGEAGIPMRQIAETIGAGLGLPTRSLTEDQAAAHFEWLARFVAIDNPTSSALTRESLGWQPREKGLLADMREGDYFMPKPPR
ncbi:nucleoside-diphosphate-sugar epimerase [Paraburkholderia sp. GAS199]|uniref:SDR family oxidoreductase n=1 Tax=Paraburkholderia sp. GAS199 TaxID=3035126 RepID=UPI003D1A3342